ncbi:MAG TPA: cupredoxin domain-containing protein [Candidatus Deferrimicrobiaceae bacterium]|nr:cupredoxin domain-containing protein [Candidatus Deferrimicrobiaceae bacterium]
MTARRETRADRRTTQIQERRLDRRLARHRAEAERREKAGRLAFGGVIVAVLAIGGYLAFGDFLGRPGGGAGNGAISVQASMAGFNPSEIHVKAGELVMIDFWTQDSPGHLQGGVHTMISDEMGLYATLPGADAASTSRVAVQFLAPSAPGVYDIYCDTCCGGRETPTMHGKVVVEA